MWINSLQLCEMSDKGQFIILTPGCKNKEIAVKRGCKRCRWKVKVTAGEVLPSVSLDKKSKLLLLTGEAFFIWESECWVRSHISILEESAGHLFTLHSNRLFFFSYPHRCPFPYQSYRLSEKIPGRRNRILSSNFQ